MNFNIEDIFGDNEDIENIIDVETLFANIIKCVLVGNKIEKVIKKSKIEIFSILNKNKKSNSEKTDDTKESEEYEEKEKVETKDITLVESDESLNEDKKEDKYEDKSQDEFYDDEDKIVNKYYY
jgi:hypothetical protein